MNETKSRIRIGRYIYFILAILFSLCIGVQIYFAGLAIFENPLHWMKHLTFAHQFGFNLPILILIFAIIGGLPRWAWQILGIPVSVFLIYFTARSSSTRGSGLWLSIVKEIIEEHGGTRVGRYSIYFPEFIQFLKMKNTICYNIQIRGEIRKLVKIQ